MEQKKDVSIVRHSAAHLLAHAISELYPNTKLTIGPATADGFFYDFLPKKNFKEADLPAIAERMREIAERGLPLGHKQISKDEARKLYKDNPFKLEIIDNLEGDTVGLATQGDFYDLCKGGHVDNTNKLKNFKLLGISGSYWRADRKGQPLQRITGIAFATPKELRIYEKRREEALKYDHRKLGRELDLFSFNEAGPGFPFFHPNGKIIFNLLIQYLRNLLDHAGYKEISTPAMLNVELWKQSGHYDHYRDNMYFSEIDETTYAVKPMNCPGAILVYKSHPHSYRELPLRLSEFGHVHRHELSGVLHGLFRVRSFTQDDAHIFCTPDQIEAEITSMVTMALQVLKKFDFKDIRVILSTKPDKAMGDDALWKKAISALQDALDHAKIPYEVHEGEGAFYGPKIDFLIKDSMDRSWQCSTVQLDFFQAENFDLWYVTNEGTKARPVIIHRALYGSLERFFGILIEHYKGKFPFWLAPTQIKVLSITDDQMPYAQELAKKLKGVGFRVVVDESSDPISGKIKNAQIQQIPWMLVVGAKEVEGNTITLRYRDGKQEHGLTYDNLLRKAQEANR